QRSGRIASARGVRHTADVTRARDGRETELRSAARGRDPGHDGQLETEGVGIRSGWSLTAVIELRQEQIAEGMRTLESLAANDAGLAVGAAGWDREVRERLERRLVHFFRGGVQLVILPQRVEENRIVPSAKRDAHLRTRGRRQHRNKDERDDVARDAPVEGGK